MTLSRSRQHGLASTAAAAAAVPLVATPPGTAHAQGEGATPGGGSLCRVLIAGNATTGNVRLAAT